jgi:Family of unknown function (DUF5715)/Transglycosylase SLT domain
MTEIAARLPRPRGSSLRLILLTAALGLGLLVAGLLVALQPGKPAATRVVHSVQKAVSKPARGRVPVAASPASPLVSDRLAIAASRGLDRGLFTSSPGGVVATAARVAQWRPLIVRATRKSHFGPNIVEGLVFIESSGRPDVIAGSDVSSAAGLTQIVAATGKGFLHLRVNTTRSRALTNRIARAESRGAYVTARQLRRWRARYDQRFSPARSVAATVRYLEAARRYLGSNDLAVVAYHMGIGNLQGVVRSFGGETPSYAQLYFGSAPDVHRATWRRLTSMGDMSRDYYWKVLAAKRIMKLYRSDPAALRFEERQQAQKSSAEEVIHPRFRTARFASPSTIVSAWKHHVLRTIPMNARRTHIAIGPFFGDQAHKLGRSRRLYRGLRPATLDVLLYIGRRVHDISGTRKPLILTSALRDNRYQSVLMRVNANAARTYSIHTTGYAFDIARAYATPAQAAAFQFVLERLQSVNAIAYIREAAAIHVAVASDAQQKLALLARA